MPIDIRLPKIDAPTEQGQISQIKSYLYQLVQQLQWALENLNKSNNTDIAQTMARSQSSSNQVAALLQNETNVVIKQGTIGDWYYRKWLNGTAECWARRSLSVNIKDSWGAIYYGMVDNFAFPSELFISAPICQATVEFGSSTQVAWLATSGKATKDLAPAVLVCSPVTAEAGFDILYHAIGSWK